MRLCVTQANLENSFLNQNTRSYRKQKQNQNKRKTTQNLSLRKWRSRYVNGVLDNILWVKLKRHMYRSSQTFPIFREDQKTIRNAIYKVNLRARCNVSEVDGLCNETGWKSLQLNRTSLIYTVSTIEQSVSLFSGREEDIPK